MIYNWLILLVAVAIVAGVLGFGNIAGLARIGAGLIVVFVLLVLAIFILANYLYHHALK
jgi:uncharacterized membrane protein YtjA (UPF0391 family)